MSYSSNRPHSKWLGASCPGGASPKGVAKCALTPAAECSGIILGSEVRGRNGGGGDGGGSAWGWSRG